jgi:hypothetical protein
MFIVTNYYLICELGLGASNGHIRTLQNMERERRSVGRACTSPRWELKKFRILHGVDRYTPFHLQQGGGGGLNEAPKS